MQFSQKLDGFRQTGLLKLVPYNSINKPHLKRNFWFSPFKYQNYTLALKPMDSFGMWWKSNEIIFYSLNHNCIVLCELLMPCQLFAQKCSNCQELTKISKCLAVWGPPPPPPPPNTLPLVIYIGIFRYWVLLHYNMSFKTKIAGGFNGAFWWPVWSTFWRSRNVFNKSTKTIWWL